MPGHSMDEPWVHYTKRNKIITKHVYYVILSYGKPKVKFTQRRMVIAIAWKEGEMGRCLIVVMFQFCKL